MIVRNWLGRAFVPLLEITGRTPGTAKCVQACGIASMFESEMV